MPKYYQGQEFREKAPSPVGQGISAGLESYNAFKAKEQMEREFANFDKLPKVQQAMVLAKYAGQPAAAAHVKSVGQQQAVQRFLGNTTAPNTSQLQNAMQAANVENMNQLGAANVPAAMTQPQTPSAPGMNPLAQKSDEELRSGLFEVPELTAQIKAELDAREENRNRELKQSLFNQQTQRDIQKENRDRIKEYSKPYENQQLLEKNVSDLEKAKKLIHTGKVSFDENIFRGLLNAALEGKGHGEIAELLKTPEQQKLFSLLKNSLKTKEIGGSNPSTREVLIALSAIPSNLKGKDANLYIIDNMINEAKLNNEKGRVINTLIDEPNLKYGEFLQKINEHVSPIQKNLEKDFDQREMINEARKTITGKRPKPGYVFMVNPETGEPREVRAADVEGARLAGGILLNE